MNIYKTKLGTYINLDQVHYIIVDRGVEWTQINIVFSGKGYVELSGEQADAFLDYLDKHLNTVYTGWA